MDQEHIEQFPESVREWDEVKNSETPEVFWDRVSNMRSKFGTALFKPGEDAGEEDWKKFTQKAIELSGNKLIPADLDDPEQQNIVMKRLGVPDDLNGYEFAEVEGLDLSDDRKAFLKQVAFDAKLTKAQLKLLDEKVRTADLEAMNQAKDSFKSGMTELRQEWGMAYDDRVHQANKIAKTFFPHLGDEPVLSPAELKSFHALAKQLGQNTTEFRDQGDQNNNTMTPQEAGAKIAEIRNNPDHPYHHSNKPGNKEARAKMRELYKIKNNIAE